jgi:formylglycine-generating enzyme
MNNFTITQIGDIKLTLPMPFIFIEAKGKSFEFQKGKQFGRDMSTIEENYWLCAYQTTQELWDAVVNTSQNKELNSNPSHFKGNHRPVEQVSWNDIQIFNAEFNKIIENKNLDYNTWVYNLGHIGLPTETEWEYAALAGTDFVFSGSQNLNDVGWYNKNSNGQTMPVGLKHPNKLGLYDMIGNVWEWCQNYYDENSKSMKTLRGGGYFISAQRCRLRDRDGFHPGGRDNGIGFRLRFSPSSNEV